MCRFSLVAVHRLLIAMASLVALSCSFGNKIFRMGESNLHKLFVNSLFSAMFTIPFQKQSIPARRMARFIASVPLPMIEEDKLPMLPVEAAANNEKTTISGQIYCIIVPFITPECLFIYLTRYYNI